MSPTRPFVRLPVSLLAVVAASVFALGACSLIGGDEDAADQDGGDATGGDDATTNDDGDDGPVARLVDGEILDASFVEGACTFDLPAGTDPRCGTVTVPANWETGDDRLDLAVAVFASTAESPAEDPVVYLEGGPGGHALETVAFSADDLVEPLLSRGDVIVFDQRGVGESSPQLGCDEITELSRVLEDEPDMPLDEAEARFAEALTACSDRLVADGIDLGQFNSVNNAHDVEAIRIALGYDNWNLLGISYGTRLGLEVLRQHPEHVRAAVLDSVFPPQIDSTLENPSTFLDSYDAVVAACGAEAACAAGGDLGDRLSAVMQRLEADPVEVEVQDYLTGETDTVQADGYTVLGIVSQSLYSPSWFTDLPELVTELEAGETVALSQFLSQLRTVEAFFSDGMFYAVECNEEISFADEAAVDAAVPADPFGLQETFDFASNTGPSAFDTCAAFGSVPAADEANEAVVSDVPVMLMAGRYDPVTPVAWAEQAAESLSNSVVVVAPQESHGVSPGECGMGIVRGFLDDPAAAPEVSCFEAGELSFIATEDTSGPLMESYFITDEVSGLTVSGVRPADWRVGDVGDTYREASFLDPTQLLQLVGDPTLALGAEQFITTQWKIDLVDAIAVRDEAGRVWSARQGENESLALRWYESELDGDLAVVILGASPAEIEGLAEVIVPEVLDNLEVR